MHSLPIAANANRLASVPTIVPGLQSSATGIESQRTVSNAMGSTGSGIAAVSSMLANYSLGQYFPQSDAASVTDGSIGGVIGAVGPALFNGVTWDRQRNNNSVILLPTAARTTQTDSPTIRSYNAKAITVWITATSVPAAPGAGGLKVAIIGVDAAGQLQFFQTALPAAALTLVGAYLFGLGAGLPAAVPPSAIFLALTNVPIPVAFFVRVTVGDAQSYTYSVTADLVF